MNYSYRVTKYQKYDTYGNLSSSRDEWTSFFDIDHKVNLEEYLRVENEYIKLILTTCRLSNVSSLKITELEKHSDTLCFTNGQLANPKKIKEISRAVLREEAWCKLVSSQLQIHFGYDFYMYIICSIPPQEIHKTIATSLNIETFDSPYL